MGGTLLIYCAEVESIYASYAENTEISQTAGPGDIMDSFRSLEMPADEMRGADSMRPVLTFFRRVRGRP